MGSEPPDGAPRPTNVTETLVANGGIVSDAFMASSTARVGWSADRAVTELYSMHYRALVRLAALLVRDTPTAEEVVQDSFVAMHDGWQRLRDADGEHDAGGRQGRAEQPVPPVPLLPLVTAAVLLAAALLLAAARRVPAADQVSQEPSVRRMLAGVGRA